MGRKDQRMSACAGNKTNADCIRRMTDEELAEWIVRKTEGYGFDGYEESVEAWLYWLKEERCEK